MKSVKKIVIVYDDGTTEDIEQTKTTLIYITFPPVYWPFIEPTPYGWPPVVTYSGTSATV